MKKKPAPRAEPPRPELAGVRVIGGTLRGRKLAYSGDLRTRPMKDRTREAIFNLLTTDVVGTHAFDLFAGTGALGIEALSRGAVRAEFYERHFPTAELIRRNLRELGVDDRAVVTPCDTFLQVRKMRRDESLTDAARPWVVFCSPPYDLYIDRAADMLKLVDDLMTMAPRQSMFVVEADRRFDPMTLPQADEWQWRDYAPAMVGLYRKES